MALIASPVTVIIPCHNAGRHLLDTVASAAASTIPALRTLVVDDGSTDPETLESLDALERGRHEHLRVVRLPWVGVAAARNEGIRRAETALVVMLDGDDLLARDYVEVCLRTLQESSARDPRVGFVYTDIILFGARAALWRLPPFSVYALLHQNFLPSPALMRREAWEAAGGYNEALANFEDRDFWFRVVEHGWIGAKAEGTVYYYRQHGRRMASRSQTDRTPAAYYRLMAEIRRAHPVLFQPAFTRAARAEWRGTLTDRVQLQLRRWYQALFPFMPRRMLGWWRRRILPAYLRANPSVVAMMPPPVRSALGQMIPRGNG